jgi:hypothetical protein
MAGGGGATERTVGEAKLGVKVVIASTVLARSSTENLRITRSNDAPLCDAPDADSTHFT